jgi:hypothetical protein
MPINFPDAPTANQVFLAGNVTWKRNATNTVWNRQVASQTTASEPFFLFRADP